MPIIIWYNESAILSTLTVACKLNIKDPILGTLYVTLRSNKISSTPVGYGT